MASRKSSGESYGKGRTRSWTFMLYPTEGNPPAPPNWREILDGEHIQWIESPLHDKDVWTAEDELENSAHKAGTLKKAHYHILLIFESVKSYEQVKKITDKLNAPRPEVCNGARGLVRYMAHLNCPGKAQYNPAEIIGHNGADVAELLKPTATERHAMLREIRAFIWENHITEFADFMIYCDSQRQDWSELMDDSVYITKEFIKSIRHRPVLESPKVNEETGEIIE